MDDRDQIKRQGPPGGSRHDIQDAEFYDVNDDAQSTSLPTATASPEQGNGCSGFMLLLIACAALVTLMMFVGGASNEVEAPLDNRFESSIDAPDAASDVSDSEASFAELLQANDARVCDHPGTVDTIRQYALPETKGAADKVTFSDAEFARAIELARVELTEVSASDIRADVHEVTCQANLRYGDGRSDQFPITYKIRPAADPNDPPVFYITLPPLSAWAIMQAPFKAVEAERPKQVIAPDETEPAAAVAPPTVNETQSPVSDEDRFAPHN